MGQKQTNKQFGSRRRNPSNLNNKLKQVPDDVDGRTKKSLRFRQIVNSTIKLAGNRQPPEVIEQLAKQFAGLVLRQEHHQSRLFKGDGRGHGSDAAYVKLVNSANRCLRMLGLTKLSEEEQGEFSGVDGLEKYCAAKRKKKDRRRERLGKNL